METELLEQIKFLLLCKNDAQAIRLIEKYGHNKQQERSYSEEEVKTIIFARDFHYQKEKELLDIDKWFEQFKNK
jgi:hypothetical protein